MKPSGLLSLLIGALLAPLRAAATAPTGTLVEVTSDTRNYSNPSISGGRVGYNTPDLFVGIVQIPKDEPDRDWANWAMPSMRVPHPVTEDCTLDGPYVTCLSHDLAGELYVDGLDTVTHSSYPVSPVTLPRIWKHPAMSARGLMALEEGSIDNSISQIWVADVAAAIAGHTMLDMRIISGFVAAPAPINEFPATDGTYVVWRFCNGGTCGLRWNRWAMPLPGFASDIPLGAGAVPSPADIDGGKVAFAATFGTERDIVVYDIASNASRRLQRAGPQDNPRISGQLVAFESGGHVEVWNLAVTGAEDVWQVPAFGAAQTSPEIDGMRIAFLDLRRGYQDVTVFDFTPRGGPSGNEDDDGDGVGIGTDQCPCDRAESNPWAQGDRDGACDVCDPLLSYYCMNYCKIASVDACPGVTDTGMNCNLHAEQAIGATLLDDACDPVFCTDAVPIVREECGPYRSVGSFTIARECSWGLDKLTYKKTSHDQTIVELVDYRACVDSWLEDPVSYPCTDKKYVSDGLRMLRPTAGEELAFDPWKRVRTEATAQNLDAVDTAMDAVDFEFTPAYMSYTRHWSQSSDFTRWRRPVEKALYWSHVEEHIGQTIPSLNTVPAIHQPGRDLANNYVAIDPPGSITRLWSAHPLQRVDAVILPDCLSCPLAKVRRGDDRIRYQTSALVSVPEIGEAGWMRDAGGLERTHAPQSDLAESLLRYSWVGGVEPNGDRGQASALPLAVAHSNSGSPAVLDFMWADSGALLNLQDLRSGDNTVLQERLGVMGLDHAPPDSGAAFRQNATVLYVRSQAMVLWVGGETREGTPARDLLAYHLLSRTWSSTEIDSFEWARVVAATFNERDSSLWMIDVNEQSSTSRVVRVDVLRQRAQTIATSRISGQTLARYLATDRDGSLLIACSSSHGGTLFAIDTREARVRAAWNLWAPPPMQPLVDLTGVRVVLQAPEDPAPIVVPLDSLEGFSPGDGWTRFEQLCLE